MYLTNLEKRARRPADAPPQGRATPARANGAADSVLDPNDRERLVSARALLDEILDGSEPGAGPERQPVLPDIGLEAVEDGLFLGGNQSLGLELRVDFGGSAVISGDLFGRQASPADYLASFRTAPGTRVGRADEQPWVIVAESNTGETATGELRLERSTTAAQTLTVTLMLDSGFDGIPANRSFQMTAERDGAHLRRLGIELEREIGTDEPPTFQFNGRGVTIESAFADAGIVVSDVGMSSSIPREPERWGTTELHALMVDFAQTPLDRPAWTQQLLWLGRPTREGLLGIMFDSTAVLPRQGTAVFDGEIRRLVADQTGRKIIQTAVHEIGHGLNLAHRFEREVGRADSASFMNYDWRYRGGNRRDEFWRNFAFTFDADELEFLRHAPRNAVVPGGAAFHSVNYWADGNGGYSPYVPEVPIPFLDLTLAPPLGGPVFAFAQPVFLEVTLTNTGTQTLNLDRRFLDPKAGFIEVLVRRVTGAAGPNGGGSIHFRPIVERCFDIDPGAMDIVGPGRSISDNLNLTFGSGGFTFAEPGQYEITAVLAIYDQANERDLIVRSNAIRIHVAHPHDMDEEREAALVLLREDVGIYFAMGGSSALPRAEEDLEHVLDRRQKGRKAVSDPIAANIVRCKGIDAGRRYRRYSDGKYRLVEGDRQQAGELLSMLGDAAMNAFDRATVAATRALAKKHLKAAEGRSGKGRGKSR